MSVAHALNSIGQRISVMGWHFQGKSMQQNKMQDWQRQEYRISMKSGGKAEDKLWLVINGCGLSPAFHVYKIYIFVTSVSLLLVCLC